MTFLLDTNTLIALAWSNHDQHGQAKDWMKGIRSFATCPMTQGGFVRLSANPAIGFPNGVADAFHALDLLLGDERHTFWPDDVSFGEAEIRRQLIKSHAQVTDKYLVALAQKRNGSLATFDKAVADAFADESPLVTLIK